MNHHSWKNLLVNSPEATKKVDTRLHENIMRAVRLAKPSGRSWFKKTAPAWRAGVVAMILIGVFFYMPRPQQVIPSAAPLPVTAQLEDVHAPAMVLEDRLQAFTKATGEPEKALREEMERLKSDLARFGFSS